MTAAILSWSSAALADPTPAEEALARGDLELKAAEADGPVAEKRVKAASALGHFITSFDTEPSWRAAAGACQAHLALGEPASASGWYWLATDNSDYSDSYLGWQAGALQRIFDKRAAIAFEFSETPGLLRVDGVPIPKGALDRPVALDVGVHALAATSEPGNTFQGAIEVTADQVGERNFHFVKFERMLRAGEEDPLGTTVRDRPKKDTQGMGALQIVSIVATVALASGIAVGGGYLLYGTENPRGIDTPEGAAVIITELVVIGGGTAIALLSDG